jgi:hypothetical protein
MHAHLTSGGRYPVLRTVAILWLVGAAVTCLYGLWQAVVTLGGWQSQMMVSTGMSIGGRLIGACMWLAGTFFAVLFSIGVAELIKLFIDIEHNSRMIACQTSGTSTTVSAAPATTLSTVAPVGSDGHRMSPYIAEESAESALIHGH